MDKRVESEIADYAGELHAFLESDAPQSRKDQAKAAFEKMKVALLQNGVPTLRKIGNEEHQGFLDAWGYFNEAIYKMPRDQ